MSLKDKNGKEYREDILAYLENRMSEGERNSFERKMEADPFLRDAVEGFSQAGTGSISDDIDNLESKILRRATKRKLPLWYRLSAAVILLLIISSVFLVRELRNPPVVATGESREDVLQKVSEPVNPPVVTEEVTDKSSLAVAEPAAREAVIDKNEDVVVPVEKAEANIERKVAEKIEGISVDQAKVVNEALVVAEAKSLTRSRSVELKMPTGVALEGKSGERIIRGTVLSSDDTLPLPGTVVRVQGTERGVVTDFNGNFEIMADSARILVASFLGMQTREIEVTGNDLGKIILEPDLSSLEEVVVVGYGLQGKVAGVSTGAVTEVELDRETPSYFPPEPIVGMVDFRDYIESNQQFPVNYTESDRVVVRLKFSVSTGGVLSDFEILKSPGEEFSSEAIRLIKEGPGWKPATGNGNPVAETIRLRIVFRKK